MKRKGRPKNGLVDAVQVVALLQRQTGPEVLLEKQFRPPAAKVCIEFPAGLLDEGESPDECALRELREETGYVGDVVPDPTDVRPVLMSCEFFQKSLLSSSPPFFLFPPIITRPLMKVHPSRKHPLRPAQRPS